MAAEDYGNYYYGIKTKLSKDGEIYAFADNVNITDNGELVLSRKDGLPTLCIAAGKWDCIFAASIVNGDCVSVEHWKGTGQ